MSIFISTTVMVTVYVKFATHETHVAHKIVTKASHEIYAMAWKSISM